VKRSYLFYELPDWSVKRSYLFYEPPDWSVKMNYLLTVLYYPVHTLVTLTNGSNYKNKIYKYTYS